MPDHPDTTTTQPERIAPAIGTLILIIAASSLLDDTGILRHPWWVSLALGLAAVAIVLMARTIARLLRPRENQAAPS